MSILLPQDLITQILSSLLPIKSLVRFQCVSKSWFDLINDPYFINLNLATNTERTLIAEVSPRNRPKNFFLVKFSNEELGKLVKIYSPLYAQGNLNESSVIGCCNGLVCISKYDYCNSEILIWNPSIHKYKKLPFEPDYDKHKQLVAEYWYSPLKLNLAFGYDSVNNDYKVLKIVFLEVIKFLDNCDNWPRRSEKIMKPLEIMVYSWKSHSWRKVEDQWPYEDDSFVRSGPAFSNGAFYWLVTSVPVSTTTLLTFDLTTEKFGVRKFLLEWYLNVTLEVLGGTLCVSATPYNYKIMIDVDVWMMEEDCSWSRLYTVPANFCYRQSLAFSSDGKEVLMVDSYNMLFWYHIEKMTFYWIGKNIFDMCWIAPYVESLLLLDGDSASSSFLGW
jgi:F-box interacting protein